MTYQKLCADYLFTGKEILSTQSVLITDSNGKIETITTIDEAGDDIQMLEGILSPGFINCHCHIELSHLKNKIPTHTGLVPFILSILQNRAANDEQILEAIANAEEEMIKNGIVAVGDISNNASSLLQKSKNKLYYQTFIETSGFSPAIANERFATALQVFDSFEKVLPRQNTIVPHAPYSVSTKLFGLVNDAIAHNNNKISSIHNLETKDENEFFLSGNGAFNQLYETIGVDIASFYQPSGKNSLPTILPNNMSNVEKVLLVHNTFISERDIQHLKDTALSQQQFMFCLCPNANLYIENKLPPIDLLLKNDCDIVLGTDSLASNWSLSILDEIATLKTAFPNLTTVQLLQWATINGAKALGINNTYGSFEKGKKPGVIQITGLDSNGEIGKDAKVKRLL